MESASFESLLKFGREKIQSLSSDILAGKIPVSPYRRGTVTPCSYCDYRSLCRFDWQTHSCRTLESTHKTEVLTDSLDDRFDPITGGVNVELGATGVEIDANCSPTVSSV